MARLYRHKTRGWQIHYKIYFPDGSAKRKWRTFTNKLRAQDILQDVDRLEHRSLKNTLTREDLRYFFNVKLLSREEADRLMGAAVEIPTIGELAKEFLEKSKIECRPRVHKTNEGRVQHLKDFFGEATQAVEITMERIERYRAQRLKDVTAATVNKEIIKLGQLLDIAIDHGAITENPARKIRKLRDTRERKPRSLTKDEIKKLLDVAKADRKQLRGVAYEIIMAYLYTGMRREELIYLEWEDVDLKKRKITIQSKAEKGGFVTKTGRARTIGIASRLAEILSSLPNDGRYVFGNTAPLIKSDGITHGFRKLADAAGLPKTITLHSLRHTYITHLMEAGVNPRRVQELAGHKTFATTWRYSHALPSDGIEEDKLDF
ncbi:MAG: site-specific integrase [Deltaproteobacteria bacterium]|nr:site-specific integrase [Deltaproteobacteria bacterium]